MTTIMDSPGSLPGSLFSNDTFRCSHFNSSLFVPPTNDSTSSPLVPSRTLSRKRPRLDRPRRTNTSTSETQTPSCRDALSPPPFVNTNYRIAGGLDTPTALNFQKEEDAQQYDFEVDCRPNRYAQQQNTTSYFPTDFPYTPSEEHTHSKRRSSRSPQDKGWGKTVWALTGGVAGKVFNFCWNTTFKGFSAGGGNRYQFAGTPDITKSSGVWTENEKEDVFHDDYQHAGHRPRRHQRAHTPIPGGFPEDEARRPGQIRTTSDWVIVDEESDRDRDSDASPVRKRSKATTASLHMSRSSTALGTSTARPRFTPRSASNRSSASYASPRSSSAAIPVVAPVSKLESASVKQHRRAVSSFHHQQQQQEGRPGSRASLASPRRQSSVPASPEVRKFEQKLRKKEAKQDQTMNRFNAQLQAMIREGQEALGARIEVVDDGDGTDTDTEVDEGYEEGFAVEKGQENYFGSKRL
ncbi:hypothetical protein EDD36DRAFT_460518 [Exophiala viscosa]|uniref:Uncharacterized protein n=1 Tax=Exophiala viscosa TaxID=2486360 RepID=A0AAN6IIX7_9EURO|nr:hypothetical protein EDD36DRAFT_460518 [Exophiala viscosa]